MYNDFYSELYHYGVVGMRKGQRRWTNPDGTLNAAGKSRYAEGKVGTGYTSARAAANKQRNSMNSQAALRSGSVGSSYTNARANRNRQMNSMNSQAALRMGPVSTSFARDDKRTRTNMTRRSMASQAALGSAKDRKRIDARIQNRQAQERSMDRQSTNEFDKARRNYESAGTKASMRSQAAIASAKDRKRIKDNHSFKSTDGRLNADNFTKSQNAVRANKQAQSERARNYVSELEKSAGRARSRNASRALRNEREEIRRMTSENDTQRMIESIKGRDAHNARKSATNKSMNSQASLRENVSARNLRPEDRNSIRERSTRRAKLNKSRKWYNAGR